MPPEGAKARPSNETRRKAIDWFQEVRDLEVRQNAGDPGLVLARRLSNSEYNATIRDLTGADIKPTREFPVDPANTAGFDNSGESLTMSPALLNKYLKAAHDVADHMVLKPKGFAFAPHPMIVETDPRQVLRQSDHRILPSSEHPLSRLLPGGLAIQAPGGTRSAGRDLEVARPREQAQPQISGNHLDDARGRARGDRPARQTSRSLERVA